MGRNDALELDAVRYLAEDKLAQANARIRHNGGTARYKLQDNGDGTFDVLFFDRYRENDDGLLRFRHLHSVLSMIDVVSAYYCACGIEDATTIDYL